MRIKTISLTLAFALFSSSTLGTAVAATTQASSAADPGISDKHVPISQNAGAKATQPLPPPSPASVLNRISNVDGKGELSYETTNGSWINYWYCFQFELGGTRYYTGFAWETPEFFGANRADHFPAPGTKVTLAHATFVANPPGSKAPWNWQGTEPYIGEFGGREKGNQVDTARKPQTWNTPSGDMLLALPTSYLEAGVRMRTIEILLFNPHDLSGTDDKRWRYLTTLDAGDDNGANCGPDSAGAIPCVNTTGTLAFAAHNGSDLPLLRVTVPAGGSKPDTVTEYRYDAKGKTYKPTARQ